MALTRNPQVQVSELQVSVARGSLQEAAGPFDTTLLAGANRQRNYTVLTQDQESQFPPGFPAPASQIGDTLGANAGISQLLRNGILISPTISTTRTYDNLSRLQDVQGQTRPVLALNVTVPLGKNSGTDVVGASEDEQSHVRILSRADAPRQGPSLST